MADRAPDSTEAAEANFSFPREAPPTVTDILKGRYVIGRLLKESRGISTYLGHHRDSKISVVIKVVSHHSPTSAARLRLEHEATILKQIDSDDVALPLHFSSNTERTVLVYPYIPGPTLQERLVSGPIEPRSVIALGTQMMRALKDIHEHGILHSDIKPSNIIVSRPATDLYELKGTLIDFGFAWSKRLTLSLRDARAGTVSYLAPEQAGLTKYSVDERADLYSAGVVLYECLSGTCPFLGESVNEVLRKQMTSYPPPLRDRGMKVPRALDELIQRLLKKDPRDRYQTAAAVLGDLNEIAQALDKGVSDPNLVVGKADRRTTLTEPAFIGRQNELNEMARWWQMARDGQGGLIYVESESGGGKTRFLEELSRQSVLQNCSIFWGQGLDEAAQRPFQLFVGVAEQLVESLAADPVESAGFRSRLAEQAEAVITALPELGGTLGVSQISLGPEDFGEIRNITALAKFLDALGTREKPALVILDDCQWADALTQKLIQYWHKSSPAQPKNQFVLLIVAFRSEEIRMGHLLRRVRPHAHLVLPPLGPPEIGSLVESMAGPVPAQTLETVIRLSSGSPFMASAVLRGIVESGTLVREEHGWRMEPSRYAELCSSRAAASFLTRRLELLPAEYVQMLSAGAVLGKEFKLELAAQLANQPSLFCWKAVDEAMRRHIVWENESTYSFVHDKIRETLLERMDPGTRRALHRKAALQLREQDADAVFEVAYHFDAAGDPQSALPYALIAAEEARTQNSLEIALQQYQIAERGLAKGENLPTTKKVAEGLGDVYLLRGEYDKATAQFEALKKLAQSPEESARIDGKLGETAFKTGDVVLAADATERALRTLGQRVPSQKWQFVLATLFEGAVQALHTLFPSLFVGRRALEKASEADFIKIRLLSRLTYTYWFLKGKVPCAWAHFREMNLAERYPPTPELAQAYSEHSPVMTMVPHFKRGLKYATRGLTIRRSFGDLWGEGQSLHFYGVALYGDSRFEECLEKCREAVRIMERTGDKWEVNTASWHIAFCLYRMGNLAQAVEASRRVFREAKEIEDHTAAGIILSSWSRASGGKVPKELLEIELKRNVADKHTQVELLLAEGVRLIGEDNTESAVTTLQKAVGVIRGSGLHQEYVAAVFPWLVTALRLHFEKARLLHTPLESQKRLKALARPVRDALAISRHYKNNLPHALREAALVAAYRGKLPRSWKYLEQSRKVAEAQGAKYELLQTLEVRAALGAEAHWGNVPEDQQRAARLRSTIHFPPESTEVAGSGITPLSIEDRFETLLEVGRKISSSLTREAIFEAVREAAINLLRGDGCTIWLVDGTRIEPLQPSPGTRQYSKQILFKTIDARNPVIWMAETPRDATDSLLLAELRSVLCAPILVRGIVKACFYVFHQQVSRLFGEEERKLASFIAALAGAALENSASFVELRELNESRQKDIFELRSAQRELARRAEDLSRSNADLEQYAHLASHDLKEPLRVVMNYIQLLESRYREQLDKDAQGMIDTIVESGRNMYRLIDALLDYSGIGSARQKSEWVNLNAVMVDVFSNLRAAIDESRAVITCAPLPELSANRIQILQLFQNFIANALKFRGKEPPRIRVGVVRNSSFWVFSIEDNGIGIDNKYLSKIFTLFHRVHARDKYPGTGVGLAICKRIVEIHGGKVWVESEPDKGTIVHFSLPAERSPLE